MIHGTLKIPDRTGMSRSQIIWLCNLFFRSVIAWKLRATGQQCPPLGSLFLYHSLCPSRLSFSLDILQPVPGSHVVGMTTCFLGCSSPTVPSCKAGHSFPLVIELRMWHFNTLSTRLSVTLLCCKAPMIVWSGPHPYCLASYPLMCIRSPRISV